MNIVTIIIATLFIMRSSVPPVAQKPNQQQPALSPSKDHILTVPIKKSATQSWPNGKPMRVWTVTLTHTNGAVVYTDINSRFVGHFNVYWTWDEQNRVWLHNSDDGRIWFWEERDDKWVKEKWGYGRTKETDREIKPPQWLVYTGP